MKKSLLWMMTAILLCGLTVSTFTSCVDQIDNPGGNTPVTPVLETDYTVMLYTAGGGNLDNSIEGDIAKAAKALKADSKKVRYLVQYKYSSKNGLDKLVSFAPSGKAGHVYRYEATPSIANDDKANTLLKLTDANIYGTQNEKAELFQPDSIASFMKYCQKVAPAKNYILMLSDHGGGYNQAEDYDKSLAKAATRAVVLDDNMDNKAISCKELRAGIEKSGMHLTLLNFDCCLMNNMETLSELTALTDYVLASGHTVAGEDHKAFVEELYKASDGDLFTEAMSRFTKSCSDYNYKIYKSNPTATWARNVDFVLTDMKKFPAVLTALKAFVDHVMTYRNDALADEYQYAATTCYQYYPNVALYDLKDYCEKLNSYAYGTLVDVKWWEPMDNLEFAIESAQIAHSYALQSADYEYAEIPPYYLSYNVSLGAKGFIGCLRTAANRDKMIGYTMDGYKASVDMNTLEITKTGTSFPDLVWSNGYNLLEFDKITGWSRWLEANTGFPLINPPYDNANDQLPGGTAPEAKDWDVTVAPQYNLERSSMKMFKFVNTLTMTGIGHESAPFMGDRYYISISAAALPAKAQFICEVTPKPGKEGAWTLKREKTKIKISLKHKGKDLPDVVYDIPDLNLSGTSVQTEGADAAAKAYVNIEINIDAEGKATFTPHAQSENFVIERWFR